MNFYGLSLDVAHHYALVATIMRDWHVGPTPLPHLGEMNYYPNLSHWVAALFGSLLGSGLIGLHVVTLVSMGVVWSVIGLFLRDLGQTSNLTAAAILLVLVWLFGSWSVHGNEIFGNFFFAQIAAEAGAFVSIWMLYTLSRQGRISRRNIIVPVMVYLVAWAHLLPALKLVAVFGLVILRECFLAWRDKRHLPWSSLISVILCGAVILVHPSFSAMSKISELDGVLNFAYPTRFSSLLGIAALLAIVSSVFIFVSLREMRETGRFRDVPRLLMAFLGSMGLAAVALLVLQMLAFLLAGYGSPYAVKKHMFGVYSLLLINVAVFCALWISANSKMRMGTQPGYDVQPGRNKVSEGISVLMPAVFAAAAFLLLIPGAPYTIPQVIPLQKFAQNYLAFHTSPENKGQVLFVRADVPPVINYLISTTELQAPRGETVTKIQRGLRITSEDLASTVITNRGNPLLDAPECRNGAMSNASTVVVELDCLWQALTAPVTLGDSFSFSRSGRGPILMKDGWSVPEEWGTWTMGATAGLAVPHPVAIRQFGVELTVRGFVPEGRDPINVGIKVNEREVDRLSLTSQDRSIKFRIPVDVVERDEPIVITFDIVNPRSPKDLGMSSDARSLGLGLRKLIYVE
jgi:hypothetical protein